MQRKIIRIDEEKCDGCGLCIPNCHEGALQIVDGKARLVSDPMCDGLGACIGHCPRGAIQLEEREAESYDERRVMTEMISKGKDTVISHLKHLKQHGEKELLNTGIDFLWSRHAELNFDVDEVISRVHGIKQKGDLFAQAEENNHGAGQENAAAACACPGSRTVSFNQQAGVAESLAGKPVAENEKASMKSGLSHWPVQMHLINPAAPHYHDADLLLAADCVAFSMANFHQDYLEGKKLAIACPKLDVGQQVYLDKLIRLMDEARINTLTIMKMEVPCCGGLVQLCQMALQNATRKVPLKAITVSIEGEVLENEWL